MNLFVMIFGGLVCVVGIAVVVWSVVDTRKKYYQEYLERKSGK